MTHSEEFMERVRRRTGNQQQTLIVLIGVLLVILILMLVIAFVLGGQDGPGEGPDVQKPTHSQTEPSETEPMPLKELTISAPNETAFTTLDRQVLFVGTADARGDLKINGQKVTVAADGSFSYPVDLVSGANTIAVTYDGQTKTYEIRHQYTVQTFAPAGDTIYGCGATIKLSVAAREGSKVTAILDGKNIEMKLSEDQMGSGLMEGFVLYTGSYKLPNTNAEDLQLGQITYTVTCDGITEMYHSGNIVGSKRNEVLKNDPSVTPSGGSYVNVGSGYIVEVVNHSAETFFSTTEDTSVPRNNYLPKGTVDYGYVVDIDANGRLVQLRCGRQVYLIDIRNYPASQKTTVVDCYQGVLPDHNEMGFAQLLQNKDYTVLVLDSLWKAPFLLDLLPQKYSLEKYYEYDITSFTAEYVEITFCYATVFEGKVEIPSDNPLFSHAELTMNEADCTLRLYLKEKGCFYGWDAYYNDQDQLCFRFINRKQVTETTSNAYGVDLTGVRIMIDVGHGGADGGAMPSGCKQDEAALNLQLSLKLKAELESMGATVIINRTTDKAISVNERIAFMKEQAPDLCIAIHQNSNTDKTANGGWICYYNPFSYEAARLIAAETKDAGVYKKTLLTWDRSKYFMGRETVCPVVLMENGFMSNAAEYADMEKAEIQQAKAEAMARGIAKYFLQMSK